LSIIVKRDLAPVFAWGESFPLGSNRNDLRLPLHAGTPRNAPKIDGANPRSPKSAEGFAESLDLMRLSFYLLRGFASRVVNGAALAGFGPSTWEDPSGPSKKVVPTSQPLTVLPPRFASGSGLHFATHFHGRTRPMTKDSTTVEDNWNMRCPQCGSDERIDIEVEMMVRLLPDGTDPYQAEHRDQDWHDQSTAACGCGYAGVVKDFSTQGGDDANGQ
jgi:hypothetical protein